MANPPKRVTTRTNTYRFTFRDKYGSCRIVVISHNLQTATLLACKKYSRYDSSTNVSCEVELDTISADAGSIVNLTRLAGDTVSW